MTSFVFHNVIRLPGNRQFSLSFVILPNSHNVTRLKHDLSPAPRVARDHVYGWLDTDIDTDTDTDT